MRARVFMFFLFTIVFVPENIAQNIVSIKRTTRKINKWVLEKFKPKSLLEVNMTKLALSYCRNTRQGNTGKK